MRTHLIATVTMSLLPCLTSAANAQEGATVSSRIRKQATAIRVANGAVRVDGSLDDQAWREAVPITDFVQKEPVEGVAPTEAMDVRIVYDDSAIYVGARMSKQPGTALQAPLGRRDNVEAQAEYILLSFDTFYDHLSAYGFGVSATGVRLDRYFGQDDEANFDEGFDPVWEARTSIGATSWTAEMWIPFSQLRFNEQAEQVWGLNVQRSTPTLNEVDYWAPVLRTERGWASRFGELRGIEGIRPTKRIEALPYVAGSSALNGDRDRRNPFDNGLNLASRIGFDLKMGLGPSLTLEATVNPDFGQVEADPAEVNLSAFETFFTEKRPFFTEGLRLLSISRNNFFYPRRIGAAPTASVSGDFVDYPSTSTILTSGKLTGRLASGLSLAVLGAVTDDESARVSDLESPGVRTVRVAPRTSYGLMRVQQEFGRYASTVGFLTSVVHRNFTANDPLAALLARRAIAAVGDTTLRFANGQYEFRGSAGFTHVDGEEAAISRVQRSPLRYMQRPDNTHARLDPTRRSLTGHKGSLELERTGGRHWLWEIVAEAESPTFEPNDFGRMNAADGAAIIPRLRYRETVPGRAFRSYSVEVYGTNEWTFGGTRQGANLRTQINLTFLNFWTATVTTGKDFRTLDAWLTRGGPLMQTPRRWTTSATLRSRASAQTFWNGTVSHTTDELGGSNLNLTGSLSFHPRQGLVLSVTPTYNERTDSQQYVTELADGRIETYGRRYVFSYIDRQTISTQFRLGYTVRPDLNLDIYAEPFTASGRYYDFGELAASRALLLRSYGLDGTTMAEQPDGSRIVTDGAHSFTLSNRDFNARSFRTNTVLRWEWRPGSTLYIVWQQDRELTALSNERVGLGDLFGSLTAPGSNFFVVKTSFWVPIR